MITAQSIIAAQAANESEAPEITLSEDLCEFINAEATLYGIEPELVYALIYAESGFDAESVSYSGSSYGLMQINKCNFEELTEIFGVTDFTDEYVNVLGGIYLLSQAMEQANGNVTKALMIYNMGAAGAREARASGIYSTAYTEKILSVYNAYKEG